LAQRLDAARREGRGDELPDARVIRRLQPQQRPALRRPERLPARIELRDADRLRAHHVPKVATEALVAQARPHVFVPGHEPAPTGLVVEHRSALAEPVQRRVRILQKRGIRGIERTLHLYNYGLTIRLDRPS